MVRPAAGRIGLAHHIAHARAKGAVSVMAEAKPQVRIRNIAEVPWRQFPNHFGGALSKPLVAPETAGSRHLDYRISM
jgi:hypothetical protein